MVKKTSMIDHYRNFYEARKYLEFFREPIPYNWLSLPESYDTSSDIKMKRFLWSNFAEQFSSDLANAINSLLVQSRNLTAWHLVMNNLDRTELLKVYQEFVQSDVALALSMPYTIKSRFYFASAHLSHQANMISFGDGWKEDRLPKDSDINQQTAIEVSRNWKSWNKLIKALEKCESQNFRRVTQDFRRRFTHRHDLLLGVPTARALEREITSEGRKASYTFGGTQSVSLKETSSLIESEFLAFSKSFKAFQELVYEQKAAIY